MASSAGPQQPPGSSEDDGAYRAARYPFDAPGQPASPVPVVAAQQGRPGTPQGYPPAQQGHPGALPHGGQPQPGRPAQGGVPYPGAPAPAGAGRVSGPGAPGMPMTAPMTGPITAPGGLPRVPAQPGGSGVGLGAAGASAEAYQRSTTEEGLLAGDLDIALALTHMFESGGSDLHLTVGVPPNIRLHGELRPLEGFPQLTRPVLQRVLYSILTQKQREKFEEDLELDFAYALPGKARFRVNLYRQRESVGAAFRLIPYEIKSLEELGIPPTVSNFAGLPRGMVLVTGPTGSGKSTTLAGLIDLANRTRKDHIVTVEDPIEFLHVHKSCLINQREVGEDTHSFAAALKHVLRQDPDIILVGEMRDLETISVALTAAETGHLVFATLHTQDAAQTIDRVIDVFPAHQQQQVRVQLAGAIQGVVCQTLCRTSDGRGRVAATEVMMATPAIRNLIREGKTHQIYSAMQAGAQHGMHTLDQHLAELVRIGRITHEQGLEKCHHVEDYNRLTGRP